MSLPEPIITRCLPGQRTPKDQIKLRERPASIIASSDARGLSHQTLLSKAKREEEAEIMSVALKQPHRMGLPYQQSDADYWVSELGKFVRLYHDSGNERTYRESTAFLRYSAGVAFARAIDNDLVARGLSPRERGDAEEAKDATVAQLQALAACPRKCPECLRDSVCRQDRRDNCSRFLADAKGSIMLVDSRSIRACARLCHDGLALPIEWHGLTRNALWRLSVHFGIEKPGYHEMQNIA